MRARFLKAHRQRIARRRLPRLSIGGSLNSTTRFRAVRLRNTVLRFARTAGGDGVYSVNVMVDGQRIHRVMERESEGVTRRQAEAYREHVKTDARKA
jgi:hypothetical protein